MRSRSASCGSRSCRTPRARRARRAPRRRSSRGTRRTRRPGAGGAWRRSRSRRQRSSRRTGSWCRAARSRGCAARAFPASSAGPAGSARAPGSGSSRPRTARPRSQAGPDTDRPRHAPCPRTAGRSTNTTTLNLAPSATRICGVTKTYEKDSKRYPPYLAKVVSPITKHPFSHSDPTPYTTGNGNN